MTHPGVAAFTALAFVLIIGRANGLVAASRSRATWAWCPSEESSSDRRRLGHIKQGNSHLRFLLVEAAQVTVRSIPHGAIGIFDWRCDAGGRLPRLRWPTD
jgi:transposase